ncbi:MAG: hypothetical protein ACFE9I_02885 [Candidatus Hermodarchaeota archaeon]
MRVRKCFRCGKELDFESYIKNANPKNEEYLTRMWDNEHIEFFCCHCYCFKVKYQPNLDSEDFY